MIGVIIYSVIWIVIASSSVGRAIDNKVSFSFSDIFVGFSLYMGVFFFITHYAVNNQFSSVKYHEWIISTLWIITILSIFRFRLFRLNWIYLVMIFAYLYFAIKLSMRYTLGEQMGDSIYLFNIVNKNIDVPILNSFNNATGEISSEYSLSLNKSYVSFYFFFSTLYHQVSQWITNMRIEYLPPYVLNMWVSNILFYFFSAGFIIDLCNKIKARKLIIWILMLVWLGLYTGSIYYNITLPHIVVTYLVLYAAYIILLSYEYFQSFNKFLLAKITILIFAMNGFGGTGALFVMVFSFGLVSTILLLKNKDAFIVTPILLIPVLEYANIFIQHDKIFILSLIAWLIITLVCLLIYFNVWLQNLVYRVFPMSLIVLWLGALFYSTRYIEDYWSKFAGFTVPQFGADRTQDYFSFTNSSLIVRNIFYYLLLISLLLVRKTRNVGIMLFVILLFFVNPYMKPLIAEKVSRYDVYNRIFFTIFNSGSVGLGLYAFYEILKKYFRKFHKVFVIALIIIMLIPTYKQINSYFYPTYMPQETDFNPLYKMGDQQVEILEFTRQYIKDEEIENPKIVSQIFGTAMYSPDFVTLGYNVIQQRGGPGIIGNELYQIFYTPAIPGDHRPEITINLRQSCKYAWEKEVDFAIYDKAFSVYDEEAGNYVPVYWYMHYCGSKFLYENDRYILFQVPRDLLKRE